MSEFFANGLIPAPAQAICEDGWFPPMVVTDFDSFIRYVEHL